MRCDAGCSRATVLLVAVVWAVLLAAPVHAGVNGSPDSIEFMSLAVHTPLNTPKLDTELRRLRLGIVGLGGGSPFGQ